MEVGYLFTCLFVHLFTEIATRIWRIKQFFADLGSRKKTQIFFYTKAFSNMDYFVLVPLYLLYLVPLQHFAYIKQYPLFFRWHNPQ